MRKTGIRVLALLTVMLWTSSCSEDSFSDQSLTEYQTSTRGTITRSGTLEGGTYSLDNVSLNSDLLVLDNNNVSLTSSSGDLENGLLRFESLADEVSKQLTSDRVLYINTTNYTAIRKIESVSALGNGVFEVKTIQAQLGEVFDGGNIDFSIDLAEKANSSLRAYSYDKNTSYEILNITGKYNKWGFEYDPSTNVKMSVNVGFSFARRQLLPSQVSTVFELETAINPSLTFAGSYNKKYSEDFIKIVPQAIMDQLKNLEFDVDIPVNTLGIETLPAKVKIQDINMPTVIEANLSKESNLSYGVNGKLRLGYVVDIEGFTSKVTPVYENTLQATLPSTLGLNGELVHTSEILIIPNISVLDNAYNVSGDIKIGITSESNGHINVPNKAPVFGTKGTFTAVANLNLDLVLVKVPIQLLNLDKVLWSQGTIDRTVVYSDLKSNVTSSYNNNILLSTRDYQTNFSLNYKYPILGKKIPDELFISYEVYQKNGTTRITSVNNLSIKPSNITSDSFAFTLSIPYKKTGGIFSSSYETESYLKNIVIRDSKGYVYEGIFNTSKNVVENNILIKR